VLQGLFPANTIFRRFLALASGSVFGQLAMIVVLPIITQIYDPADFGLLGAFSAIIMLVIPASCLRFDIAIPIASKDNVARALLVLGFFASAIVSVVTWIVVVKFGAMFDEEFAIVTWRFGWLIPLSLWVASLFSLVQYWAVRSQNYGALAFSHAWRGVLGATTQVGLGVWGVGSMGLLLGQSVYMGVGAFMLVGSFIRCEFANIRALSIDRVVTTARRYWRFPVFSMPEALLDSAGMYLPLLLVASLLGAEAAGFLYLAQRLTRIPVGLIGSNLSRVFIGEAPRQLKNNSLSEFTFRLWRTLFLIGIVPAIIAVLIMPALTEILFGSEWSATADIVVMLIPSVFLQFCVMPISTSLHVLSKQAVALVLQATGLVLQVGSIIIAFYTEMVNPITGLAIGATVYYVIYTVTVICITQKSKIRCVG